MSGFQVSLSLYQGSESLSVHQSLGSVGVWGLRVSARGLGSPSQEGGFRGGLVSKAHRLVYHSTLGSRVMVKKEEVALPPEGLPPLEGGFRD